MAFSALRSAVLALPIALFAFAGATRAADVQQMTTGREDVAIFAIVGQLNGGETLALQGAISRLPPGIPVAVVLNSPGGLVVEGFKLGEFFYKSRIPTFVMGFGGMCASACSLAFLGGRDPQTGGPARFKMTGGRLGFHQFRIVRPDGWDKRTFSNVEMTREANRTRYMAHGIIKYLKSIEESLAMLHLMLRAPNEDMRFLTDEEALPLGINVMADEGTDFIDAAGIRARVNRP